MKLFRSLPVVATWLKGLILITSCSFVLGIEYSKAQNTQDELDVIRNSWLQPGDIQNSLYNHFASTAFKLLEKRSEKTGSLKSLSDWKDYQKSIQETLLKIVGPFPEKTQLNARVIRRIDKDGYSVEHIIFESQPGFLVISSLFLPSGLKKNKKAPVVIYCSGHSVDGYKNSVYQHVILNLVKKGFAVFAFDPVGQGERVEYFDPKRNESFVGGTTKEHSYAGTQAFITGSSEARYMIWDGIRSIDYLLTRKEIDPSRIGITGRSGGGTQSALIAALDDRIYASAPENYLTNFTRLFQSIGPQDACQNLFHEISCGIDHADFLIARAPKPALMITTSRDIFSIQGGMETEREVARVYKAYGKEQDFKRVEDDAPHASTLKNRESMYRFFGKYLNNPCDTTDLDVVSLTKEEMQVTPDGNIATLPGTETVFTLNRKESEKLIGILDTERKSRINDYSKILSSARNLSGYIEPVISEEPVLTGRIQKDGFLIEKYFVKGEGEYLIPYLLFKPANKTNKFLIYLHPSGKAAEAAPGGEIEWFVRNGFSVLAPDLIGSGETGPGSFRGDSFIEGNSHNIWYGSVLTGGSIVGVRAGDVVRLSDLIKRSNPDAEIYALARKEMGSVLLHAAAFDLTISHIALISPLSSYRTIVMNRFYNSSFISGTVAGALTGYDLPDLAASLAPRRLLVAGATDGTGKYADSDGIAKDMSIINSGYQNKKSVNQLIIAAGDVTAKLHDLYKDWFK